MAAGPRNVSVVASGFKVAKALYVMVGGTWRAVKNGYVVDNGWKHSYTRSDKQTKTFVLDWSQSYRISGTNYSSSMLDRKSKLLYYGSHKSGSHGIDRKEGALAGFKDGGAAIREFLKDKSVVEKIDIRLFGTHNYYSSPVTVRLGWHDLSSAPSNANTGWKQPFTTNLGNIDFPKSKTRISKAWTGVGAQEAGMKLKSGAYKGIGIFGDNLPEGRWGFGGGAIYRADSVVSGVPKSYASVNTSSRLELVITADY